MSINKANRYGEDMDWVYALKGRKEPRDYETRLASVSEEDAIENALEQTMEAVFNIPTSEETSAQAINRMAHDLRAEADDRVLQGMINEIKGKLANRDVPIDPVALGVEIKAFTNNNMEVRPITQAEWDESTDVRFIENVAKLAVLAFEKKLRDGWQERAMQVKANSQAFDPEHTREGRIMSAPAIDDDSPRFGSVPENANSIWDADRIGRLSKALSTDHDRMVSESKEYYHDRSRKAVNEKIAKHESRPSPVAENESGRIMPSGSHETEAFIQRVPSNKLSMLDNFGVDFDKLTPEEKKARLEKIFMEKVPDPREETRLANKERSASIKRENHNDDRSWEKVNKPLSTSALEAEFMKLWDFDQDA